MANTFNLKPFIINLNDINFIFDQINFQPLFTAAGDAIINWGGTGAIFDPFGNELWNGTDPLADAPTKVFGTSYAHLTSFQGIREVTGLNNNLLQVNATWGAVDQQFVRLISANYDFLDMDLTVPAVPTVNVDVASQSTINETSISIQVGVFPTFPAPIPIFIDTINRSTIDITTTTTTTDNGHTLVSTNTRTVDQSTLTELAIADVTGETVYATFGPFVVPVSTESFLTGGELDAAYHGFSAADVLSQTGSARYTPTITNPLLGADATVTVENVIDYTPRLITQTITTGDVELLTVGDLFPVNGVPVGLNPNHIVYNTELLDDGVTLNSAYTQGQDPNAANFKLGAVEGIAIVQDYGLLQDLGIQDNQNLNNDEYFIGSVNPGVAPTNGFFAVFGQFFDHGLDFIAKKGTTDTGETAKIKIALAVDDPLYGVIGPNGRPTTEITITRATPTGVDENGDARYINHTSPFVDQSQSYGSTGQIESLLREWVEDPNNPGSYVAGTDLVDSFTLENSWTRWDGVETNQTLVTVNTLRQHMRDTNRDDLNWEDILDVRNRDESGKLIDSDLGTAGVQTTNSGHALLLDMNPRFEAARLRPDDGDAATSWDLNAATKVDNAVTLLENTLATSITSGFDYATLNVGRVGGGDSFTLPTGGDLTLTLGDTLVIYTGPTSPPVTLAAGDYTGASALALFVDFSDFSIRVPATGPTAAIHDAVSDILVASVGDHYLSGDGRVNENAALTSIHHVFHEEHNFQVQNVQTWVLRQDDNQSTVLGDHPVATDWMTAITNTATAITNANVAIVSGQYEATGGLLATDKDGDIYVVAANTTSLTDSNFVDFVRTPPVVDAAGNQQPGAPIAADGYLTTADGYLSWNQEKMFEAVKLIVETEYNHVATDQFAGAVTPDIPEFVGYNSGRDASISLEFAQNAYRYGHSTLRETIDVLDPDGGLTSRVMSYALEAAFLNPELFAAAGPGGLILGQSRQQMNEIDEIITPALQQGLLGLPLDLAAINIARGRDVGLATFNQMREGLGFSAYTSWADYGANMVHPESIVKFIAAYSFDGDVAHAQALFDAANGNTTDLLANFIKGDGVTAFTDDADAINYANSFMNGTLSATFRVGDNDKAIDLVDAWMGGIAEVHVNGGLLGETFNAIFVEQITALKDGDRFYYLYRLFGNELDEQIKAEQFKDIVERTTGTENLNGNIFGYAEEYHDFSLDAAWKSQSYLYNADGTVLVQPGEFFDPGVTYYTQGGVAVAGIATSENLYGASGAAGGILVNAGTVPLDGTVYYDASGVFIGANQHKYGQITDAHAADTNGNNSFDGSANVGLGIYSDAGGSTAANGDIIATNSEITTGSAQYIQDIRTPAGPNIRNNDNLDGEPGSGADSHEVIVGTDYNDIIYARGGDDTVYGGKGNDLIFGGNGSDALYGGDGHDIIHGGDGPEVIDGGAGDDILYGDSSESAAGGVDLLIGGVGNDILYGGGGIDELIGNGGDDIIFGGNDTDPFTRAGDGNDYVDGGADGDLLYGDDGDDLVVGGDNQDIVQGGLGDDILRPGKLSQALGGGPDEVIGGDGFRDGGFDIMEFNDWDVAPIGVDIDLNFQANPLIAVDGITPNAAFTQIQGVIGTQNADNLIGDSFRGQNHEAGPTNGANWLIGGTGSDNFTGNGGNDVIIGGSIRLDTLIGQYQAAIGAPVLANRAAYNDYNAYDGASHRVTAGSVLSDGLLGNAAIGTDMFDLHFQKFLHSDMFKDYVLGDGDAVFDPLNPLGQANRFTGSGAAASDTGTDVVNFSGNRADYTITNVQFTDVQGNNITAYKVVDNRAADALTGVLLNGDGIATSDGTDLVLGVEEFAFADQTLTDAQLTDVAPTLAGFATANEPLNLQGNFLLGIPRVDTTGLLNVTGQQWQSSADGGITWIDVPVPAISTPTTSGTGTSFDPTDFIGQQLRAVVTYDGGKTIATAPTETVGEYLRDPNNPIDGEVQGTNGQDIIVGLSGDDQLQGGDGSDFINGGTGVDQMQGGLGNDFYVVDNIGDQVTERNNEGIDEVRSSVDWTLGANVENLRLTGNNNSPFNIDTNGTGNALDNRIIGNIGDNVLSGGAGNDFINGARGSDTINWSVGDGRDVVNGGGGGNVALGTDTFSITGDNTAETFNIYAISGVANTQQRNSLITQFGAFAAGTEIVITRVTGAAETVIAELNNIEEILVNGGNPPENNPTPNIPIGGDTIKVMGNFTPTSLLLNTITIQGTAGNDTIDISGLTSEHRIVLKTNGGNDTIIGDLRPQDVIELTNGNAAGFIATANADGTQTLNDGTNSITLSGASTPTLRDASGEEVIIDPPSVLGGGAADEGTEAQDGTEGEQEQEEAHDFNEDHGASDARLIEAVSLENAEYGTYGGDQLDGSDDVDDVLFGREGDDIIGSGAGEDVVFGGSGDDVIFTSSDNDTAFGGAGDDVVVAGSGDDLVYGQAGDDLLFGGEGDDTLKGGKGDDELNGGKGVDLLFGGDGHDSFIFTTVADSGVGEGNSDKIIGFTIGEDTIDLSAIDADSTQAGQQSFQLAGPGEQVQAGQITYDFKDGNTIIEAHINNDEIADFQIKLTGEHTLSASDFNL
ncbi:MAG: hypothetical protein L3J67_02755 [Hyphomicrobiaceae bacterium]|nr:hypothetical protein [Hyphomicrobiaceae bacterium]